MIFALFMIIAALALALILFVFGGFWTALIFIAALITIYRIFAHDSGSDHTSSRNTLNAFQEPLSDD